MDLDEIMKKGNDEIIVCYNRIKDNMSRFKSALCDDGKKMQHIEYMYKCALENKTPIGCPDMSNIFKEMNILSNIIDNDYSIYYYLLMKDKIHNDLTFDTICQFMNKIGPEHIEIILNLKKYMDNQVEDNTIEFCLYNIDTPWDMSTVINDYRESNYKIEHIAHWFYYNISTLRVETINVDEYGHRCIVPVKDLEDIKESLPKYINVFLDNIPTVLDGMKGIIRHNDNKYIIVKANNKSNDIYWDILEYIKSKPYVTVDDIAKRWYSINGKVGYKKMLSHLTNASIKLSDISSGLKVDQLVKSQIVNKDDGKEDTCYFYFNGTFPIGIRVPKHYNCTM